MEMPISGRANDRVHPARAVRVIHTLYLYQFLGPVVDSIIRPSRIYGCKKLSRIDQIHFYAVGVHAQTERITEGRIHQALYAAPDPLS